MDFPEITVDINALITGAFILLVLGLIASVGAIIVCNMATNGSGAQAVSNNSCQAILNFAKFFPIIGNLVGS